jgi:hypothetical protein
MKRGMLWLSFAVEEADCVAILARVHWRLSAVLARVCSARDRRADSFSSRARWYCITIWYCYWASCCAIICDISRS